MSIDIKLLAEDLMVLRHVPYEALETVKTQHVTLHLDALEAREFASAVRRGAKNLRKESAWALQDGRTDQGMAAARRAGMLEGVLEILVAGEEEAA